MNNGRIKEWDFTIERGGVLERTVVGMDGQVRHPPPDGYGKDQHFSAKEERTYRQIIDAAIVANGGTPPRPKRRRSRHSQADPEGASLSYDGFGILPADGMGRLSSEDY